MTGQRGILFTILTCMTFSTQIHVLFQRVNTERGMCRACCEGIQTPNALVPLTNATQFHLHSTRATPSNTHTHSIMYYTVASHHSPRHYLMTIFGYCYDITAFYSLCRLNLVSSVSRKQVVVSHREGMLPTCNSILYITYLLQ